MKKINKFLKFIHMRFELDSEHPKQISRVIFRLTESDPPKAGKQQQKPNIYKTKQYGNVTPNTISWDEDLEMPYFAQESMKFETLCQHQYGYQIEELKAIYNGSLYLKTEDFFQDLTAHVFNDKGVKCGIFRYMIKVVERQEAAKQQKKEVVQQEVKVELIGRVTLYAATLKNMHLNFNPKKLSLKLQVMFGNLRIQSDEKLDSKWNFPSKKIEIMEDSPTYFHFIISHDGNTMLVGALENQELERNKRFITQQVEMYDIKNQKMAILQLDIRYLNKKQLLDLMYSPKQLQGSTMGLSELSSRPHHSKPQLSTIWGKKQHLTERSSQIPPVASSNNPESRKSKDDAERLRHLLNRNATHESNMSTETQTQSISTTLPFEQPTLDTNSSVQKVGDVQKSIESSCQLYRTRQIF